MSVKERLAQLNKTGSSLPITGFPPPQQHQLSPSKASNNISNKFKVDNDTKESSLHSSSSNRALSPPPYGAKSVHYSSIEGNDVSNNEGESSIKKTNSHNEAHMSKPIINVPGRRRPSRQSLAIPSDHILTKADIEAVESVDAAAHKSSTESKSSSIQQKSETPSWKRHQSDSAVDTSSTSHAKEFGLNINSSSSSNFNNNIFKSNSTTFKGNSFSSGVSPQSHIHSTNNSTSSLVQSPVETVSQSSNSEKSLIERLEKMVMDQDKRIKMLEDELQHMRSEMKKHGVYQERQTVSDVEKSNASPATPQTEDHHHHKPSFVPPPSSTPKSVVQTTPQYGNHPSPAIKSFGSMSSTASTPEPPLYSQGKDNQIKLASISSVRDKFNKPSKPNDEEKIQPSSSFSSQNHFHGNDKWSNQKKDEDKTEHFQPIQPISTVSGSSSSYVSVKESISSQSDVDASTPKEEIHIDDTNDADEEYEKLEKEQGVLHDTKEIHDGDTNDDKNDSDDLSL